MCGEFSVRGTDMFKKILGTAAAAVVISASAALAASVNATSYSPTGHSFWFSSPPPGTTGPNDNAKKKFLFENTVGAEDPFGTFTVTGMTATLTGVVRNAALEGFDVLLNLVQTTDPGVYKEGGGIAGPSDWTFWDIDTTKTNTLTSLTAGLASYRIEQHGSIGGTPLAGQLGVGANDKNLDFGFSTWTKFFTPVDCVAGQNCTKIKGDINISLSDDPTGGGMPPVPLPAGMLLLPAGLAMLAGLRRRRKAA
ncbi:MAG: VPLPA-CTERM sorting domain-containing protein [Pseudomonadota bacterium]